MDKEDQALVVVNALSFLQCFDTVGWFIGRASDPITLSLIAEVPLLE